MNEPEASFIHTHSIVEPGATLGRGTKIWAFTHVLGGAKIGAECNICNNVFIENDVLIGDRVTVKCGVQIWDGIHLENDVFVGPNASFTNDRFPRSKMHQSDIPRTKIEKGASIGANATILPGITIGEFAMIGAGAVVTNSVPPYAIVVGNPARIVGYANAKENREIEAQNDQVFNVQGVKATQIKGVSIHKLARHIDMRGELTVGEFQSQVPFIPKRFFLVFNVPSYHVRGEHAHLVCHQFIVCTHGSVSILADDGENREEYLLSRSDLAVYLPPLTWSVQYKYSSDAVLLVFASHEYDSSDYIRKYSDYRKLVHKK